MARSSGIYAAPSPSGIHPFPERIDAETSPGLALYLIVDNYGTHKYPRSTVVVAKTPSFPPAPYPHIQFLAEHGRTLVPRDHRQALAPGILERLWENAQAYGGERRKSPPREGTALLQGLAICGVREARMTLRYRDRGKRLESLYVCQRPSTENARPLCQSIPGDSVNQVISRLIVESVNPLALEVVLSVQKELQSRLQEADRLRQAHVERARFQAEQAQRR